MGVPVRWSLLPAWIWELGKGAGRKGACRKDAGRKGACRKDAGRKGAGRKDAGRKGWGLVCAVEGNVGMLVQEGRGADADWAEL